MNKLFEATWYEIINKKYYFCMRKILLKCSLSKFQKLYVFLNVSYGRISIYVRIRQHICFIAYTSCTTHIFIFSSLEKNNSIKKSHLSLNKAIPSPNESCRAVWKFFFGVYDTRTPVFVSSSSEQRSDISL